MSFLLSCTHAQFICQKEANGNTYCALGPCVEASEETIRRVKHLNSFWRSSSTCCTATGTCKELLGREEEEEEESSHRSIGLAVRKRQI